VENMTNSLNEFRQDLVSGHWTLFSTERSKRPNSSEGTKEKFYQPKEGCPFEDPIASGNQPIVVYNQGQKVESPNNGWTAMVIKNKYPALRDGLCGPIREYGPFKIADGNGFHELVITHDHDRSFAHFTVSETAEVIKIYKERYLAISQNECGDYIQIIHNHGKSAGASVFHNHSQILSTPILPPHVMGSIRGSMEYYKKHQQKVHDVLISWETQKGTRIVHENDKFVSFCPFSSRTPYEVRIYPKKSNPGFHHIEDEDMPALAEIMNVVLKKINVALGDPDYNFFIHTAPISSDVLVEYDFYHWHVEILPRISKIAGFELGTNIFINGVDPDEAARLLRETKI
jgi:UDPglucose--hexose-1-phosphate uridylyltransferase